MSQAGEQQADKGAVETSQTHESQSDERLPEEPQTDKPQSEESQTNEAQNDEAQPAEVESKGAQPAEVQSEGAQPAEVQSEGAQPAEVETKGVQADQRKAEEERIERERASGNKLWSAYITEAQNYDQGLLEGWRSEMDGLLIFAGLFSGVITTFIIDSYKTLNPDSGSQTVVLLTQTVALLGQISLQLANMNNGTAMVDALPPTAAFSPPASSLVCNVLWFTSLALSLSSALVATLVKQWAQEYQHRTSMFSSPSVRARVYMYLFHGLQRFNMHAVVGVPPLLLHASLLLFFAGLVAFLVPINIMIMGITSALLFLFVSVYGTFSALPLFFVDCPYQTPLTRILWSLNQSWGSMLRAYIRRAMASCKAFIRTKVAVPDPEKATESAVTSPDVSGEVFAREDTHPESQSMLDAIKSEALHPPVKIETHALAWAVRSLSDDEELEKLVEGLPQTLWDFDKDQPRGVYQTLFQSLLRDPEVHLGQRLADFMAGSNSNLLEPKDRLRRQLSVLRAIWAICAFSLHTDSPLQSPIGEADVDNALLGSKFHASPDVQSMILDVTALIRLNMIESRSRERAPTQPSNSDAEAEKRRHADMHRTYTDYLVALSKSAASFQRDATCSLFDRSQMRFTEAHGYDTLQYALHELIDSALDKTADETAENVVFAARLLISPFAHTSEYPILFLLRVDLGPFLVRHPSLTVSDPKSDSKHHYTRLLCHMLCRNLKNKENPQESVDALELIYRTLLESDKPPKDLETHLLVLRNLRAEAPDIRTHRLAAIVLSVVLCSCNDSLEREKMQSIFGNEGWFRSVLGLDNDGLTEQASAEQIYECVRVGVWTTFFEQCAARSPDQTERDADWETLRLVGRHAGRLIRSVIPTGLQRRYADAASAFMRKYPENCLADLDGLFWVLFWAVHERDGWMTDVDALRVLDVAVSEVQTDDQQESHRDYAQWIRRYLQKRLESVPLGSDGE
ncbi:unnamed protein product [Mycena citricolor]|uniref:DUF6535 domain-containing protein n=1 Tax=Mycena citricolor TaxID=2018698 RepID=A0AAD2GWL7_9AGAR|nr:unnamed protein product [Mycena citricolor]